MRRRKKATNANECGGKIRYYLVQHISALVAIAQRKQIKKRYMHLFRAYEKFHQCLAG